MPSIKEQTADTRHRPRPPLPGEVNQRLNDRIENALTIVAALLEHDEAYLPIFLRLEAERAKADARSAALARARALLLPRR